MFEKIGLIGALASIVSLALYFLPLTTSSQSQPRTSVSTTGEQSPAIGSNEGNVTINYNAPVKEKNSVLRNPKSGATPLLDSPHLAVVNDPKHHVCLVPAGTPATLTGRIAAMGKIKDGWQEVTVTTGDCANKVGWAMKENLPLE
jgi:hypothetical protein